MLCSSPGSWHQTWAFTPCGCAQVYITPSQLILLAWVAVRLAGMGLPYQVL